MFNYYNYPEDLRNNFKEKPQNGVIQKSGKDVCLDLLLSPTSLKQKKKKILDAYFHGGIKNIKLLLGQTT